MDIRKVKKLIELLEESGIAEIEINEGEEAVRISRMPDRARSPCTRRRCIQAPRRGAAHQAGPAPAAAAAPARPARAAQ